MFETFNVISCWTEYFITYIPNSFAIIQWYLWHEWAQQCFQKHSLKTSPHRITVHNAALLCMVDPYYESLPWFMIRFEWTFKALKLWMETLMLFHVELNTLLHVCMPNSFAIIQWYLWHEWTHSVTRNTHWRYCHIKQQYIMQLYYVCTYVHMYVVYSPACGLTEVKSIWFKTWPILFDDTTWTATLHTWLVGKSLVVPLETLTVTLDTLSAQ